MKGICWKVEPFPMPEAKKRTNIQIRNGVKSAAVWGEVVKVTPMAATQSRILQTKVANPPHLIREPSRWRSDVVFGATGSPPTIGAVTLEGFLLGVDPVEKRLVPVEGWQARQHA